MRKFFSIMRSPVKSAVFTTIFFMLLSAVLLLTNGFGVIYIIRDVTANYFETVAEDYKTYTECFGADTVAIEQAEEVNPEEAWLTDMTIEDNETEQTSDSELPIKDRTVYGAKYMDNFNGIYVINEDNADFNIEAIMKNVESEKADKNAELPQILIIHTHTTEAYNTENKDSYRKDDEFRSDNEEENMINIGNIIADRLTENGFTALHSKTVHDKDFNHAYSSSNKEISQYLSEYPSIRIVLDIHRDTLVSNAGTRYRAVTELNGERCAQVMFLMGTGNDLYPFPNWKSNFCLALKLQKTANEKYPGLMRPILLRNSRYNQQLTKGSLLVEIGTDANSQQEAERAAEYFADVLISYFSE